MKFIKILKLKKKYICAEFHLNTLELESLNYDGFQILRYKLWKLIYDGFHGNSYKFMDFVF